MDARNAGGETALSLAARHASLPMVRHLLDAGADPLAGGSGDALHTPLAVAARLPAGLLLRSGREETTPAAGEERCSSCEERAEFNAYLLGQDDDCCSCASDLPTGSCWQRRWPFAAPAVALAPLIGAAMLEAALLSPAGAAPDALAVLRAAAAQQGEAAATDSSDMSADSDPLADMLRLAAAGVSLHWAPASHAAHPAPFRDVVKTLLLCLARGCFALPDDCLFHVLRLVAAAAVWPTVELLPELRAQGDRPAQGSGEAVAERVTWFRAAKMVFQREGDTLLRRRLIAAPGEEGT